MEDASDRRDVGGRRVDAAAPPVPGPGSEPVPNPVETRKQVAAVYERHGAELWRFVLGVVRDPDVAGDVMQATLSKALEAGHGVRPERLKAWLFRVAYHEALGLRRRRKAGDSALRRLATLGRAAAPGPGLPDERLILGETVAAVREALGALPEDQRRVVVARVYDGKTFAQIARDSGLPLGTVLTRMRLALDKLRRALRPSGDGDGGGATLPDGEAS